MNVVVVDKEEPLEKLDPNEAILVIGNPAAPIQVCWPDEESEVAYGVPDIFIYGQRLPCITDVELTAHVDDWAKLKITIAGKPVDIQETFCVSLPRAFTLANKIEELQARIKELEGG